MLIPMGFLLNRQFDDTSVNKKSNDNSLVTRGTVVSSVWLDQTATVAIAHSTVERPSRNRKLLGNNEGLQVFLLLRFVLSLQNFAKFVVRQGELNEKRDAEEAQIYGTQYKNDAN